MDVTRNEKNKYKEVMTMKKQLKETVKAYLSTIIIVVYLIGLVTIAHGTPHTWQGVLVVVIGIPILYINLLLE